MKTIIKTETHNSHKKDEKRKVKELKGYLLYKAKDIKTRNDSKLLIQKMQNLSGLLQVRSVKF